jgi:hypothetical protein
MSITRKQFLGSITGGTVALLIQACGGGGSSSAGSATVSGAYGGNPASAGCGSSGTQITGNHGHVLTVLIADLDSATAKTYSIMGSATHDHTVTLTPADLAQIKSGGTVTVVSSVTDAPILGSHSHGLTVSCM